MSSGHVTDAARDGHGEGHGPRALFGLRSGPGLNATPRRSESLWTRLNRPDSAALHGLVSSAAWLVVGTTIGFTMSNEMTNPDLFSGIPQLVFSRLRPTHVNIMLFGFLSTAMFGAWFYLVPRLCRTQLRSDRAGNLFLFVWNLVIIAGSLSLMWGQNKGHEYAEYPWYIDWPVEIAMLWNLSIHFATIAARRESKLYVSLWYIGGTLVWIPIMYAIGNVLWHPWTTTLPDGQVQYSGALFGLNDAVWNWFYGHNVFGLYVTTGGIAVAYYLVPKITRRPLYSHALSLIGFWGIAILYAPTGQHHLLQTPIPNWLKILAVIGSVGLFIPVFSFNTNLFMTMRGAWGMLLTNIPLRFVLTGAFFYLAVSFQGSIQSLMVVNRYIHYTQWVIAHAHLALFGAFGFILSGAMLWMVPQVLRKPLWSRNLADATYWFFLVGINGFFWSLTAAGLAQAAAWVELGQQVVRAYEVLKPFFYLRTLFGSLIWVGAFMLLTNVLMTVYGPTSDPAAQRAESIRQVEENAGLPESATLDGEPVVLDS